MNKHKHEGDHGGFDCPGCLPRDVDNPLATGPHPCPERLPTRRFSSPNSSLPPDEFQELKARIEAVNAQLRELVKPRDRPTREALRLRLRALRGRTVRVKVICKGQSAVSGGLGEVGRDWIQVDTAGSQTIIAFGRIGSIEQTEPDDSHPPGHHGELREIDPSLRRDLILRFGEVVSANPELINIFYGLPFHVHLISLVGRQVEVRTEAETVEGRLLAADEGSVQVALAEQKVRQVRLPDICWLRM